MIIQCEKCRTRFRLDDSRVTDSGIRVRCSRCSHTFVVKRDKPEESADFDTILQGLGGSVPEENVGDADSPADEDAETSGSEEPSEPQPEVEDEEEWAEEGDGEGEGWDHEEPLPDEPVFDFDSLISSLSRSDDFQELDASAAEPEKEQETADSESDEETVSGESFSEFLRKGAGLPQFQVSPETDTSVAAPETKPETRPEEEASDFSRLFDVDAEMERPTPSVEPPRKETSLLSSISAESGDNPSIREHLWPVADPKDEEGGEDEMPPLSISSRRKGSPLVPVVIGVILLLALGGGGFYLFMGNSPDVAGLVPESVRSAVGLESKSSCPVEIRSLEGAFLANKDAGEIFVMRGDAFNVSLKPLTTIQVKGKIFGPKGEVIAQRTVSCGNVLSGQQLAFQPYSSMEKVMNRQFGETLANLDVQPGKGISFMIVFKAVPKGATDYAVEVVSPVGPVAP